MTLVLLYTEKWTPYRRTMRMSKAILLLKEFTTLQIKNVSKARIKWNKKEEEGNENSELSF